MSFGNRLRSSNEDRRRFRRGTRAQRSTNPVTLCDPYGAVGTGIGQIQMAAETIRSARSEARTNDLDGEDRRMMSSGGGETSCRRSVAAMKSSASLTEVEPRANGRESTVLKQGGVPGWVITADGRRLPSSDRIPWACSAGA